MISIISDIHIKNNNDNPSRLFLKFLEHEKIKKSDKIVLLGDIFDFLVGGEMSFSDEHKAVFSGIDKLIKTGKKIYYVEGNHDFHIDKFFKIRFPQENFILSKGKILVKDENVEILICHGDDIEIENLSYKIYRFIVKSFLFRVLAQVVLPFTILKKIGRWTSERSRKNNITKYESNVDYIRDKFRRSAERQYKKIKFKTMVTGHSHIKDQYKSENGFNYINNGYVPRDKVFTVLNGEKYEFINLT